MKYKEMFDEALENKTTKQLVSTYFEFKEKGMGFVGLLLGIQPVSSKLGGESYNQYLFDTDDGLIKCSLGRATDGEAGVVMKVGQVYSVKFLGSEDIGHKRRVNRFDIIGIMTEEEAMVGGAEDKAFEEEEAKGKGKGGKASTKET